MPSKLHQNYRRASPARPSCRTESIAGVASGNGQHRTCHLVGFVRGLNLNENTNQKLKHICKTCSEGKQKWSETKIGRPHE